jgi:hypothetical protein
MFLVTWQAQFYQELSVFVDTMNKTDPNGEISIKFERAELLLADFAIDNEKKIWGDANP